MSDYVKIDGTTYAQSRGSLVIQNRLEERSTAQLSISDSTHALFFARGHPVEIYINSGLIFGGIIDTPSKINLAPDGAITHSFQCIDWHYLADKRLAAVSYVSQTCGYIVNDLITNYLADEGITVGEIQDGPVITEVIFSWQSVSTCMDALAQRANFTWWIGPDKKLYFVVRSTYPSPWAVTRYDIKGAGWAGANPLYRNTQYARGGKGVTVLQTETQIGDGINQSFTMGYPLAKVPTVTVGGASQTVGIKGIDTGKDFYWSKGDSILLAIAAPGAGVSVVMAYYGQYGILVKSADDAQIVAQQSIEGSGTGIVESIIDDLTVSSSDAAFELASANLAEYSQDGQQLTFVTVRDGLDVGQMATITYLPLGINALEFLISAVTISVTGPIRSYSVTAIRGALLGSWAKYFSNLAAQKLTDVLFLGTSDVLGLLTSPSDNWAWSESISEMPFACPLCGVTCGPGVVIC